MLFKGEGVLSLEPGRPCVVAGHKHHVHSVEGTGELCGIERLDSEVLWIGRDVVGRGLRRVHIAIECDELLLFEHTKAARQIGGVVGDADAGAIRDLVDGIVLVGIHTQAECGHLAEGHQVKIVVCAELRQIVAVLHEVRVDAAGGKGLVRLHVIVELLCDELVAIVFEQWRNDLLDHVPIRSGAYAHFNRCGAAVLRLVDLAGGGGSVPATCGCGEQHACRKRCGDGRNRGAACDDCMMVFLS